MADPGHDNDYQDLGSFDDDSSVISVSAASLENLEREMGSGWAGLAG